MKAQMQSTDKAVIALKPMQHFERYGSVRLNHDNYIAAFKEKQFCEQGLINGGVYLLNTALENLYHFPDQFSFEKDFLEQEAGKGTLRGFQSDGYFIDIGIPEDYHRAEKELK
jgi:D-glycero-alpha-D-manno-heptose 1-phosphate guanylyltransferase